MDQQSLIIILLFIAALNKRNSNNQLHKLGDYIKNIKVDPIYTQDKVQIAKRITPYLPEEHNPSFSKAIVITEKIVKIMELVEFLNTSEEKYIQEAVPLMDNRERIRKILSVIKEEVPNSKANDLGVAMELLVNIDKYKNLLEAVNGLMTNQDMLNDPNSMMKLMETFMGGSSSDSKKMKEMAQMMEIMKVLNTPKKEKPIEEQKPTEG